MCARGGSVGSPPAGVGAGFVPRAGGECQAGSLGAIRKPWRPQGWVAGLALGLASPWTALPGRRGREAGRAVPPTPALSQSAAGVAPEQPRPGAPASATISCRIPVSGEEGDPVGPWATLRGAGTRGGPRPRLQGARCPAGSALGRSPRIPVALGRPGDKLGKQPGARWPRLRGGEEETVSRFWWISQQARGERTPKALGKGLGVGLWEGSSSSGGIVRNMDPRRRRGELGREKRKSQGARAVRGDLNGIQAF